MHFSKKLSKGTIIMVALGALSICTIVAFSMISTATNEFKAHDVNVKMYEEFTPPPDWDGEKVDKKVFFESKGTAATVLRVKYTERWEREDGLTLSNKVSSQNAVFKEWTAKGLGSDEWVFKDGWYYYKHLLKKGEPIQILESIKLSDAVGTFDKPIVSDYFISTYELSFVYESQSLSAAESKGAWDVLAKYDKDTETISWD